MRFSIGMHPLLGTLLGTLCGLGPAVGAEPQAPVRRALLVGIGSYPPEVHWPALEGPRADVAAMRAALLDRFEFRPEDLVELHDEAATHEGIAAAFAGLVERSGPGDLILFYFAGHGSRLLDDDPGEEVDGWDETLVPYDACLKDRRPNDIRDDEIGRWIASANAKTDQVVLVFDCCSSGTNVRDEEPGRTRFLSDAARGFDVPRGGALPPKGQGGSGWMPPRARCVALSACRAHESAFEVRTGADATSPPGGEATRSGAEATRGTGGGYRGLFTMSLVEELRRAGADLSWNDLMQLVSARVAARTTRQTPVVEGSIAGYGLFSSVAPASAPRFQADISPSGELRVDAGLLHGVVPGAVLSVCRAGASADEPSLRHGEAEIVDATAGESLARWRTPPPSTPAPGPCTAFLLESGPVPAPLPVSLEGDGASALAGRLSASQLVRQVDAADARFRVVSGTEANRTPWKLLDATGRTVCELALDSEAALARLSNGLATLGRAWRAKQILPASAARGLSAEMTVRMLGEAREDGSRPVLEPPGKDADGRLRIAPGRAWSVFVENRSEVPIYASFVLVFPDGEIVVPCPPGPDDRVQPGGAPGRCTPGELEIPPELAGFYADEPVRLYGVWTPRWQDLSALAQGPFSLGPGSRGADSWSSSDLVTESWSTQTLEISLR